MTDFSAAHNGNVNDQEDGNGTNKNRTFLLVLNTGHFYLSLTSSPWALTNQGFQLY